MKSQPDYQTITTHILLNISRSNNNQAMKFGQLIEYNQRKTFLDKLYTKYGGESITEYISKSIV